MKEKSWPIVVYKSQLNLPLTLRRLTMEQENAGQRWIRELVEKHRQLNGRTDSGESGEKH